MSTHRNGALTTVAVFGDGVVGVYGGRIGGLWTFATSMFGLSTDRALAWKYKQLGLLPEGPEPVVTTESLTPHEDANADRY